MKVLVIHTAYQFKGGEDSVVANEIALLTAIGAEVDLLQFSNSGGTLKKVIQLAFNYSSYKETIAKIKSYQPDIVHIHNLHFGGSPAVIYAVNKCRVPFVITLHNYRMLCPSATLFFNGANFTESVNRSFSWTAVFKGVYQHSKMLTFWISCSMWLHQKIGTYQLASKFIALGAHTKDIFLNSKFKSITKNIVIKPNFCYSESKFNDSTGEYYLYIGRLSNEKGLDTLLAAFAENKLPLKIAGTGPMEPDVLAYSKSFPNIQFLGSVDKDAVDALLNQATALIFPSKWFETFGMVIIEAFSKSVPVIASDLGQLKFTIKNKVNGLHFEAGNVKDLIEKVTCYQDLLPESKSAYRKNAFDSYHELYTPGKNAVQLMDIYNKMLMEVST